MNKKRKGRSWPVIFLCCLLAVPTMEALLGRYGAAPTLELARPALTVGALLGVAYLLLRPGLKLLTLPIGCLTLGLTNFAIDVGLLYGCAGLVPGYAVPGVPAAVLTALLVNILCAVGGSKH